MTTKSELRDVLGSRFDVISVEEQVRVGRRNTVYRVTVDGRRAACKMTDSRPSILAREAAVQRVVGERTSVPVPDVLAMGDGYLLSEWMDGEPYDSSESRQLCRTRLRAVGRTLGRLHGATEDAFGGHGTLQREEGLSVANPVDWSTRFVDFVADWASNLAATRDADVGAAVREAVQRRRDLLTNCSPVLVHGEVSPAHVLFEGQAVSTLLDWELAQAAPGAFDLVWAERDLLGRPVVDEGNSTLRRALLDGYESKRKLGPGFPVRRELYRAGFAMRELSLRHDRTRSVEHDRESLRSFVHDRLEAAECT